MLGITGGILNTIKISFS